MCCGCCDAIPFKNERTKHLKNKHCVQKTIIFYSFHAVLVSADHNSYDCLSKEKVSQTVMMHYVRTLVHVRDIAGHDYHKSDRSTQPIIFGSDSDLIFFIV